MICSAYVNAIFPFKYTRKNYVESFNEIAIFVCALIQQVLAGITMSTSFGSESQNLISEGARTRQALANFVMSIVSCLIAVNLFFSTTDVCHQVVLHAKRWFVILKSTQKMN